METIVFKEILDHSISGDKIYGGDIDLVASITATSGDFTTINSSGGFIGGTTLGSITSPVPDAYITTLGVVGLSTNTLGVNTITATTTNTGYLSATSGLLTGISLGTIPSPLANAFITTLYSSIIELESAHTTKLKFTAGSTGYNVDNMLFGRSAERDAARQVDVDGVLFADTAMSDSMQVKHGSLLLAEITKKEDGGNYSGTIQVGDNYNTKKTYFEAGGTGYTLDNFVFGGTTLRDGSRAVDVNGTLFADTLSGVTLSMFASGNELVNISTSTGYGVINLKNAASSIRFHLDAGSTGYAEDDFDFRANLEVGETITAANTNFTNSTIGALTSTSLYTATLTVGDPMGALSVVALSATSASIDTLTMDDIIVDSIKIGTIGSGTIDKYSEGNYALLCKWVKIDTGGKITSSTIHDCAAPDSMRVVLSRVNNHVNMVFLNATTAIATEHTPDAAYTLALEFPNTGGPQNFINPNTTDVNQIAVGGMGMIYDGSLDPLAQFSPQTISDGGKAYVVFGIFDNTSLNIGLISGNGKIRPASMSWTLKEI